MKKGIIALAALAFMAWGCSSSDDGPTAPPEIQQGTDEIPATWVAPNYDLYEQVMYVEVQLQDTLVKYASTADMLCATIGSEVRGLTNATQVGGQWLFPITIASNDANQSIDLNYYCHQLHRIFTLEQWTVFDTTTPPTGIGGIYKPVFVE